MSRDNKTIISGAADSVITFWEDCTKEQEAARESARAELVLKYVPVACGLASCVTDLVADYREQHFLNYVALQDYRRAIEVALSLGHPGRLLHLFKELKGDSGVTGSADVDQVLQELAPADLVRLLRYVRDWNTRASSAAIAQRVLNAIVKLRPAEDIAHAFEDAASGNDERDGLHEVVEGLIPYTERHLARMERLVQESYVVDYVLREMDDGLAEDDGDMDVDPVYHTQPLIGVRA